MNNDFNDVVFNRHAVKVFDAGVKISRTEMCEMLSEAVAAPSSVNMQPWRFVVVESDEGKAALRPLIRFNTRQNDTSSAMILVFGDMRCYTRAEEIYGSAVERGFMPEAVKRDVMAMFLPGYESAPREKMNDIVKVDCSLAAMQLMLVARSHGYDTCPIGGFEEDRLAEAFGLDAKRYVPVIIVAIGKADYVAHESVRLDVRDLTRFV